MTWRLPAPVRPDPVWADPPQWDPGPVVLISGHALTDVVAKTNDHVTALKANPGRWSLLVRATNPQQACPYLTRGCEVRAVLSNERDFNRYAESVKTWDIYGRWPHA